MSKLRLRRPSGAMAIALVALFVALGGTTFAMSSRVSGNSIIKKHSLSGNRLINDSVTGKQVKESTLGKVPSAKLADLATAANALNGVQIVAGPTTANPLTHQDAQTVVCPTGMQAIAGGTANSGGIEEAINDAHITSSGTGTNNAFRLHMNNNSPTVNDTFHVYVVCIHGSVTGTP